MYLEAFKALDCLTEDAFSTSAQDLEALKNLQDDDDIYDEVDVYDVEATTSEDIEDSYIGKVILDCGTCHSLFYKTPDEIVIDDEEGVANISEECPICASVGGYKIVGEVAPFGDFSAKSTEDAPQEMNENIVDSKKKSSKDRSKKKASKSINEATTSVRVPLAIRDYVDAYCDAINNMKSYNEDKWDRGTGGEFHAYGKPSSAYADRVMYGVIDNYDLSDEEYDAVYMYVEFQEELEWYDDPNVKNEFDASSLDDDSDEDDWDDDYDESLETSKEWEHKDKDGKIGRIRQSDGKGDRKPLTRDQAKEIAKFRGHEDDELYPVNESKSIKEGIFGKKKKEDIYTISVKKKDGKWTPVHSFDNKQDAVKFKADYEKDHPDEKYMLHTGKKFESLDLDIKDLNESIKSLSIDTDDTRMEMTSDETGKVTVTTEPIDNASDAEAESAEVIAPVSDETVEEIEADEESVDLDIDEIDEESFDDFGESLLKDNYNNVKSFKTLRVTESKDKLFIEGVIRFTSGKRGRTTFILESAKIDRNNKVQFVARNKELNEGIELPVVRGSLRNKKLIFEKFSK